MGEEVPWAIFTSVEFDFGCIKLLSWDEIDEYFESVAAYVLATTACTMMGVHLQIGCVEIMVIKHTYVENSHSTVIGPLLKVNMGLKEKIHPDELPDF